VRLSPSLNSVKGSNTAALIVVVNDLNSGPGSGNFTTIVWAYQPKGDEFERVFGRASYRNWNEETRLITSGPLAGDIIVSVSPRRAPYRYGIEVYRPSKSGRYLEILKFTGKTRYGDRNALAVIDSEMPAILTRLHLWKPGDPLPAPLRIPNGCTGVELRDGTEWCIGAMDSKP